MTRLLAAKVNANCREEDGDTPLHVAAGNGHDDVVRLLVGARADLNAVDSSGHLPEDDAEEVRATPCIMTTIIVVVVVVVDVVVVVVVTVVVVVVVVIAVVFVVFVFAVVIALRD